MIANLVCSAVAVAFAVGLIRAYRKQKDTAQIRRRLGLDK